MELAFSSLAYPELDLAGVVSRVKSLGYDALELRVADDGKHIKPSYPLSADDAKALKSVRVVDLAAYARFSSDQAQNEKAQQLTETLSEIASDLGVRGIRVYVADADEKAARALDESAKIADRYDVKIMVETHDPVLSKLGNLQAFLQKSREAWVLYDPANMTYAGEKHEKVFPLIKGRIAHVHLKDFVLSGEKRVFCRPGMGVVPMKGIVRDLKDSGYDGALSVEWERLWNPEMELADSVLPDYLKYLRSLLQEVMRSGTCGNKRRDI
ncbi:sugar phosphate isomerase/epimerase [Tardisphaera miroshnichenkoae]